MNTSLPISISPAKSEHILEVRNLLQQAHLPYSDVDELLLSNFLILIHNNSIVGAVGLEIYAEDALLRSLVLTQDVRGNGFGKQLVQAIESKGKKSGIKNIYLLTTTADTFFEKEDYKVISRKDVPEAIQNTTEFSFLCPDSAICMTKQLG